MLHVVRLFWSFIPGSDGAEEEGTENQRPPFLEIWKIPETIIFTKKEEKRKWGLGTQCSGF